MLRSAYGDSALSYEELVDLELRKQFILDYKKKNKECLHWNSYLRKPKNSITCLLFRFSILFILRKFQNLVTVLKRK